MSSEKLNSKSLPETSLADQEVIVFRPIINPFMVGEIISISARNERIIKARQVPPKP